MFTPGLQCEHAVRLLAFDLLLSPAQQWQQVPTPTSHAKWHQPRLLVCTGLLGQGSFFPLTAL